MVPEENLVFDPEASLRDVVKWTHYLPGEWKGKLHSQMVNAVIVSTISPLRCSGSRRVWQSLRPEDKYLLHRASLSHPHSIHPLLLPAALCGSNHRLLPRVYRSRRRHRLRMLFRSIRFSATRQSQT